MLPYQLVKPTKTRVPEFTNDPLIAYRYNHSFHKGVLLPPLLSLLHRSSMQESVALRGIVFLKRVDSCFSEYRVFGRG